MAFDVRVPGRVPKLAGLQWPDVAPYLEEFLKRLVDANDGAQTTLREMDAAAGAADDALARRAPTAHTHGSHDVLGLDPGFPRRPATHVHAKADVVGLDDLPPTRPPAPHTHGTQDLAGIEALIPSGPGLAPTPGPHVHGTHDIQGLLGDRDLILASQVFGG